MPRKISGQRAIQIRVDALKEMSPNQQTTWGRERTQEVAGGKNPWTGPSERL